MSRIQLTMSGVDAMTAMVEGNPGAITALIEIGKAAPAVDPQSALGAWGPMMMLDSWGIYGSDIWLLYNDIANRDAATTIMLIRACQLGIMPHTELLQAIAGCRRGGGGIPPGRIDQLREAVKQQLPQFDRATEEQKA